MFSVQVAADIFSNKTNFELTFPSRPSIQELIRAIESTFTTDINNNLPDGVPPHSFTVSKVKAFDDNRDRWVDLVSDSQLIDFCQVYAFQPENPWHKESQKAIPPAVKPPTPNTAVPSRMQPTSATGGSSVTNANATGGISSSSVSRGGVSSTSAAGHQYASQPSTYQPTSSLGVAGGASSRPNATGALVPIGGSNVGGGYTHSSSSAMHHNAAVAPASVRPSVDAPFDERVRVVFNEFDLKGHRILEMDDLRQGFRALGFEFTNATMNDLFQKGDINNDGRITYSEFERFAKLYPIMTDCLFYRSKAFWDEDNLAREVMADKEAARLALAAVQQMEAEHSNAQRAVDDANRDVDLASSDMQALANRLKELRKSIDNAHRNKEKAAKEKAERESDLAEIRDRERQARQGQVEAAREAEKIDRRAVQLMSESQKAEEKVKQLEAALLEARRAAERAQQATRQAQAEAEQAKLRERDLAKQADTIARDLPTVESAVRSAELNLQHAHDSIRDLDGLATDINRDSDEAARRREAAARAVEQARSAEGRLADDLDRARRAAADKEQHAKLREEEFLEAQRQRQQVTANERQLVEQELRLREQRDTLEQKEGKLKNEAGAFLAGLRSSLQSQGRAYSRDPSVSTYAVGGVSSGDYRRDPSRY